MSEVTYRADIIDLGVFSLDNNDVNVGYPLENGAFVRRLPWAQNESLSMALDYWWSAEAAADVLGSGKVGLAANIGGIWFRADSNSLD
jgi:hypothetical protein